MKDASGFHTVGKAFTEQLKFGMHLLGDFMAQEGLENADYHEALNVVLPTLTGAVVSTPLQALRDHGDTHGSITHPVRYHSLRMSSAALKRLAVGINLAGGMAGHDLLHEKDLQISESLSCTADQTIQDMMAFVACALAGGFVQFGADKLDEYAGKHTEGGSDGRPASLSRAMMENIKFTSSLACMVKADDIWERPIEGAAVGVGVSAVFQGIEDKMRYGDLNTGACSSVIRRSMSALGTRLATVGSILAMTMIQQAMASCEEGKEEGCQEKPYGEKALKFLGVMLAMVTVATLFQALAYKCLQKDKAIPDGPAPDLEAATATVAAALGQQSPQLALPDTAAVVLSSDELSSPTSSRLSPSPREVGQEGSITEPPREWAQRCDPSCRSGASLGFGG